MIFFLRNWICTIRLLRLCGLAVALWLPAAPAFAQNCQIPPELMTVARTLAALPGGGSGTLSPAMTDRLADQLNSMSEARIVTSLNEKGLNSVSPVAVDVLAEAERLAAGASYNASRLSTLLRDLDQQSTLACADSGKSIFQRLQNGRKGGIFQEKGFSWSELEKRAQEQKLFAAGAVVVAMVGFISTLVLIDAVFRWVMALLYNRKACRIPAMLTANNRQLDGFVITVGKGGCRFHPTNMQAFDSLLADLRGREVKLVIEDIELAVSCSAILETVANFKFEKKLTIKMQREILSHSTISPYFIRKSHDGGEAETAHLVSRSSESDETPDTLDVVKRIEISDFR